MLTLTGTPYYRAPEMFEGGGYSEAVDLWALGVTVFKLMVGFTPFESEYHAETIENIMKGEFDFPPQIEARFSKQARLFVGSLLRHHDKRPTAVDALKDLWFIDIQGQKDEYMRSMTMNRKYNLINNHLQASMNPPMLTRNNTVTESIDPLKGKSKQEVLRHLKSLDNVEEQTSMIYGFEQEQPTSSTKFKVEI